MALRSRELHARNEDDELKSTVKGMSCHTLDFAVCAESYTFGFFTSFW